ncbi:methylenetetrahydrofolate reductase (NAD(P)H) met13 [Tieghemiomyces parasiticus]|uniref:methylenetetrahydrofolate reductase (NADH) n=1 Tax=Tieghemiomyces parasiticus TaxID=78921 RepID=A0A9W8A9W2_9FUNG|nr:methylenetetrahydrofolate reductase (NAD(P)H) met13 [Tieghemiomyces parasiticus]
MKVIHKIEAATKEDRPFWSFEYFPPKTQQGVVNLYDRMERMYKLGPEFIDVTWGAGGTTSRLTTEICRTSQNVYGLETCMHLTCTNMSVEMIETALRDAKESGIQNILALRGDPPRGEVEWTACENGFAHAVDLVRYIRQHYGDYFCVSVAGYPEGHLDATSPEDDLAHLKNKVDAGADYIVTQLFYDVDMYLDWIERCRAAGIHCPILAGIMPIQSYNGFKRMTTLCKTAIPDHIHADLEPIKEDDQAVKQYGVQLAIDMCSRLRAAGHLGFHFYTLNLEKSTRLILEGLRFVAAPEKLRPLPWNPSLGLKRRTESVRPIFWRNRARSYVARTEAWDEFPNGRWGDSRSPAFGELDGYGMALRYARDECLAEWDHPTALADVYAIFARYCQGEVKFLPWSDQALQSESTAIRDLLEGINRAGYLTVNSQPAVNGARSSDPTYGWGPKNGYVYQKCYLEFFVSPAALDRLISRIDRRQADPASTSAITYYAVNRRGDDLRSNTAGNDEPNAVTWGVFPGQEIKQPTIVEAVSFMAWKDEAFELWQLWANLYPADSPSRATIQTITSDWYLVNLVDNDFQKPTSEVFKLFEEDS